MKEITLVLRLDEEADAAYVSLASNVDVGSTVTQVLMQDDRIRGGIVIDVDGLNNVLGIELIGYKDARLEHRLPDVPRAS